MTIDRRILFGTVLAAVSCAMLPGAMAQEGDQPVLKVGYALAMTGPNAGGATTTSLPNYRMWVHEVNERGGLRLGDATYRLEAIEYDDRSNSEEAVRAVERLITQDEVDILLPPWGTAINLAVAPLFDRHGFPQITATAFPDGVPNIFERWPRSFWMTGTAEYWADALSDLVAEARDAGHVGSEVAMISVADGFGIDVSNAAREAFAERGFTLTYDRSYPVGTQDFSSILAEVRDAEIFVAYSYPPDTIAITDQMQVQGFNPDIIYVGVGGAFPIFRNRFGASVEGLLTHGGLDPNRAEVRDYIERHVAFAGAEPDHDGSIITYTGLQAFEQAIERVGSLDYDAISEELKAGTFETIIGEVSFENQQLTGIFKVGQYRDGLVVGLSPRAIEGAGDLEVPKRPWPAR